ncbi:MAG TPA: outer membrane beta-barrel protein [Saprospiraceae bacterium]|nr:outer membrane beta-barrel protein [Saprospiraceae bacterium]
MIRLLLFVCLTGFSHMAYSQSGKFQFGLLVKGGNFTLPNAKSELSGFRYQDNIKSGFKPGYQHTFGVYGAYRISPQFSIIAELSYRLSYFEYFETQQYQVFDISGILKGTSRYEYKSTTNSLVAPIKFQFSPKKLPKWHFQAGGGICHNTTVKNEQTSIFQLTGAQDSKSSTEFGSNLWETSDFRSHFTTGILYQISNNTKIGIEYLFERYYTQEGDSYFSGNPLIDFIYLGSYPPSMHSFSVSLQHNLLH